MAAADVLNVRSQGCIPQKAEERSNFSREERENERQFSAHGIHPSIPPCGRDVDSVSFFDGLLHRDGAGQILSVEMEMDLIMRYVFYRFRCAHPSLLLALTVVALAGCLACGGKGTGSGSQPIVPPGGSVTPLANNIILFDSNRNGNYQIFMMKSDGSEQTQITAGTEYDSFWPKPSPDRTKILFTRTPAGFHERYSKATTWVMNADGTGLTQILPLGVYGWTIQGHPEWKPDGSKIVTMGGLNESPQIFIINPDGTDPVRLTNDGSGGPRPGRHVDPSWKPDGEYLLFVGCPGLPCSSRSNEIYRIKADGTGETRLTSDSVRDNDPYYSPNTVGFPGTGTIAWLRNVDGALRWAIFKMNPDGANQTAVIDDGGINSKPAWTLDSSAIYFHRLPVGMAAPFNVWKISPDRTGLTEVILPRPPYANEYPVNGIN